MDPKPPREKARYTIRDVAKVLHKEAIRAKVGMEHTPGTGDYLAQYPGALTSVMEDLTDEQIEEAEEMRDRWNVEGPDDDDKSR